MREIRTRNTSKEVVTIAPMREKSQIMDRGAQQIKREMEGKGRTAISTEHRYSRALGTGLALETCVLSGPNNPFSSIQTASISYEWPHY